MANPVPSMNNPQEIGAMGEQIYEADYKAEYEKVHAGMFVAIDVTTRKAYIAEFAEQALNNARQASPGGIFHLIKVGSPGAFRVSYTSSHAGRDWILR